MGFKLILSGLLIALIVNLNHIKPLWDNYIVQNFHSINKGIYFETEMYFHQFLPFLIVLIPITTAVCHILSSRGASEASIIIITLFMFSFWNNGLDKLLKSFLPFYILITLSYYSLSRYEKTITSSKAAGIKVEISYKRIFLYTILLSAFITLSTNVLSQLSGNRSIMQLRSEYASKEASLLYMSKKSSFNLSDTGYGSNNERLGGPVQLNNSIALKVKADYPAYIRGTVKDYYDSVNWNKSTDSYKIKGFEALIEPNPDFNKKMTGSIVNRPLRKKMTIYHYGIATSTLFSPNNTSNISIRGGKVMYDSSHTFMLLNDKPVNEPYTITYFLSSTAIEHFDKSDKEKKIIEYQIGSGDYHNTVLPYYKKYLQIPQSITPRTYELVKSLTANCRTADDMVRNIMNYLSKTYPYSLKVSQVPPETDFVDYFLFTERKGYCTYFASASVIMCRIAGIPARYVEGFNMDDEKDADGMYTVRNHRAHAWAEVLIDPRNNLWSIVDCVPQGVPASEISDSNQYRDRFADDRYKFYDSRFTDTEFEEYNINNILDYKSYLSVLFYPFVILPLIVLLVLLIYILYKLIKIKRKLKKLIMEESIIPLYEHLVSRLKVIGQSLPDECCELEYAHNIQDKDLSECLVKIITACYSEHYGGKTGLPAIDKNAYNKMVEKHIRRKQSFLRYWYCIIRYS